MKVMVLGAGGPAGVNWSRALHAAGHDVLVCDEDTTHLDWLEPYATPASPWQQDTCDVVHACPDNLVLALAQQQHDWSPTLLPAAAVVELCQDKAAVGHRLGDMGLRVRPLEFAEEVPDYLKLAEEHFGRPFWLRARYGAGARGAALVDDLRIGYHWLRYWEARGCEWDWIAEPYLPGRDFAWTGIYADGQLVTSFVRERLEYIFPNLAPSGLTGTPTRARIAHDDLVNEAAEDAIDAVDEMPNGIYAVDLREDVDGMPRVTEINAGRGGTTVGLWSLYDVNFADIHARLAAGCEIEEIDAPERNALPEDLELRRHIDCGHVFIEAKVAA